MNIALTEYLSEKFEKYGITIANVSLSNIEVDEETRQAINAKITAQQNAETQSINNQTNIDKAAAEAQVKLTQAQAEADVPPHNNMSTVAPACGISTKRIRIIMTA